MMMNNYQSKRSLVRWLLIIIGIVIPFVVIDGRSLLRFDLSELVLYFFGLTVPINNFFVILLFTLFLTFLFITVTLAYGRIWCGWMCPQSVSMEATSFVDKVKKGEISKRIIYIIGLMIFSIIAAMNMVFYFVNPYNFISDITNGSLSSITMWFVIVLAILIFLDVYLVRFRFCATVCPYSMIQSVLYDDHTLAVHMIPETKNDCIKCQMCVKVCSTGIDIRNGMNSACINCAKCIDACAVVMGKKGKSSLFAYRYGSENIANFKRPTILISSFVTFVFFASFIWSAATIKSFEFETLPNVKFMPRYNNELIINSYKLALENFSNKPINISVTLKLNEKYSIEPSDKFIVQPKQKIDQVIFIKTPKELLETQQIITTNIVAKDEKGKEITKTISLRKPFGKKSKGKEVAK